MNLFGKSLTATLCSAVICCACPALALDGAGDRQVVTPSGTFDSARGPESRFTGNVRVDRIFKANEAAPYTAALVTFEPGARTNWHSHPAGQHLVVALGVGRTGTADGKVVEFRAGDEIWCPPNIRHWHGAAPRNGMTHIAITGLDKDGKSTDWMEPVTDEQYNAR